MEIDWSLTVTCWLSLSFPQRLRGEFQGRIHKLLCQDYWKSYSWQSAPLCGFSSPTLKHAPKTSHRKFQKKNNVCSELNSILKSNIKSHAHPPDLRFSSPVFVASLAGLWVRLLWDQPVSQCVNTSFGAIGGFRHSLRISEHITSDKGRLFYKYRENKYPWILSTFLNGTGQHGGARKSLLHTEKDTQNPELVQTPEIYVQAGYIIIQNSRSFLELQFYCTIYWAHEFPWNDGWENFRHKNIPRAIIS